MTRPTLHPRGRTSTARPGRLALGLTVAAVLGVSQAASSQTIRVPAKSPPKSAAVCANVTGGVRAEAYGYKHVVTLRNGCDKPVECQVWTDVDPEPRNTLRAAPGESVELVTRIGSPASAVTAGKECRFL